MHVTHSLTNSHKHTQSRTSCTAFKNAWYFNLACIRSLTLSSNQTFPHRTQTMLLNCVEHNKITVQISNERWNTDWVNTLLQSNLLGMKQTSWRLSKLSFTAELYVMYCQNKETLLDAYRIDIKCGVCFQDGCSKLANVLTLTARSHLAFTSL